MARVLGCAEKTVGTLFPIPLKTNLLLSFSYPIEDKPTIVFSSPVVDNYKNIIPALKPKTILSFEEKIFGVSSAPPVNVRKHKMVFEDNCRPEFSSPGSCGIQNGNFIWRTCNCPSEARKQTLNQLHMEELCIRF